MKTNDTQDDMNNPKAKMGIATQRRLIKDLRTLEIIVKRRERQFIDLIEPKVPVRFANAKKARYKSIVKASNVVTSFIQEGSQ